MTRGSSGRLVLTWFVVIGLLVVGCGQPAPPAQQGQPAGQSVPAASTPAGTSVDGRPAQLKIGIVTFLSGAAAAPFGIPARDAAEVLLEQLNAGNAPAPYNERGIAGVPIKVVYVDENGGTEKQVAELRRLVLDEKVDLVIGYISSGDCLAVAPVAEELKTLTVLFDCGTHQIFEEKSYKYVFRTAGHQMLDSVSLARYLAEVKKDVRSIAGINQNYAWGQDSWNAFRDSLLQLKPDVKVVTEQFPKLGAGEFSAEISALQSAKPDVIHSSFWGGDLESFIIQGSPRGIFERHTVAFSAGEPAMPRLGGDIPEGVIIGARGPHGALAPDNELNRWFKDVHVKKYKARPVYAAYHMSQAIFGVKAAYEKAFAANGKKWPSKDQVISALTGLEFDTPSGKIKMALGEGHQAVEEGVLATSGKLDSNTGEVQLLNVKRYPAECVNPPPGVKSADWIKGGFKGAKC